MRTWLIAAAAGCVTIVAVILVATGGFGLLTPADHISPDRTAHDRCESDVRKRLASPSTATLSNVKAEPTALDPDTKDLFSLLDAPLRGVDHARITVWNVSGVVDITGDAFGGEIHDRFGCRAYFVDGTLEQTLVVFDHDH